MSFRIRQRLPVVALVAVLALAAYGHLSAGAGDVPRPLPFDPLSDSEQAQAIEAALDDPLVKVRLLDGAYETIGAALRTEKIAGTFDRNARLADVWFYHYTTDTVVWAVVDMHALTVRNHVNDFAPFQPPLTVAEAMRAEDLALAYREVQERLPEGDITMQSRLWNGPGTDCPIRRCVLVAPFVDGAPAYSFFVKVNLSEGRAFGILENPGYESDPAQDGGEDA